MKKTKVVLTDEQRKVIVVALNELRNRLLHEGRYTDAVDETFLKIVKSA